ncbi:MAG: hypothetical protein ACFCUQ_17955 [Kiloniellales bacterium]
MTTDYRMLDRVSGQRLMTVRACDIERIEEHESDPDLSYLDPDADPDYAAQNAERLAAYRAGAWHCIAIKARAALLIGLGEAAVIQVVESPGLWGIESDSDPGYLDEVSREETETLRHMLAQRNVTVVDT